MTPRHWRRCMKCPVGIVRIVMTRDHDDPIFVSGKFRNDVMDRKLAFRRIRRKAIGLHFVALEMRENVIFNFLVISAADRRGPKATISFTYCIARDELNVGLGPSSGVGADLAVTVISPEGAAGFGD